MPSIIPPPAPASKYYIHGHVPFGGLGSNAKWSPVGLGASGTYPNNVAVMPACTVKRLFVKLSGAQGGTAANVTLRKNDVATALLVAVAANDPAGTEYTIGGSVACAEGDRLQLHNNAAGVLIECAVYLEVELA